MVTIPLATVGPTITEAGITVPALEDIIATLQFQYRAIYGQDVDLSTDTQDGEWIALQGQAQFDTNDAIVTVYQAYSPTYAQGTGLSSVVKINGIQRELSTNSTAACTIIGQAGTVIPSGIVVDDFGNQWFLPSALLIPIGGEVDSFITASNPGAITLASGSTTIGVTPELSFVTPIPGWQSLTTTEDAILGAPVESDALLRIRQTVSTGLPAQTPLEAIVANVANLPGVTGFAAYENDTGTTDGNGIPGHSICIVVAGGDPFAICTTIADKKNPGTGTFGSVEEIIIDPTGVPNTIRYQPLSTVTAYFVLGIHPLNIAYTTSIGQLAVNAVAQALSNLVIGETAFVNKLFGAANLNGDAATAVSGLTQQQLDIYSATYNVTYIHLGIAPNPPTQVDISITFDEQVVCIAANGSVTLT